MFTGRKTTLPVLPAAVAPYYGCEGIARLVASFIMAHFPSNDPAPSQNDVRRDIEHFVAFVVHRGQLLERVVYGALYLLELYAVRIGERRRPLVHALFITACKFANYGISGADYSYYDRCWSAIAQNRLSPAEVGQLAAQFRLVVGSAVWFLHNLKDLDYFIKENLTPYRG